MTIESAVFTALRGLVADEVYPDLNDSGNTATRYIVFQAVGGPANSFLENAVADKQVARVQVVCWVSTTRDDARDLGNQAEAALVAIGARPVGAAVARYDEVTKYRGSSLDFIVSATR